MSTEAFNVLDRLIAGMRLVRVEKYIENGDRVLDFGCGSQGYFLRKIADKIGYGLGIDLEINPKKSKNLEFKKQDKNIWNELKLNSFNKVVMLAVLEHIDLDKVSDLFAQFRRVLKTGGFLVMTTPTPPSKPMLEFMAKIGLIDKAQIDDHKKYYERKDVVKLAKETGFKMVSYKLFQFGLNSEIVFEKV
ncbi:MAG: class I SAM-dependent methyltransferase [Candidatus Shapirobacteria bacterium]